jgi:formate hydrogenlyase subunit 3/multisubunit Na+/H+ antiporter MnhD subunit
MTQAGFVTILIGLVWLATSSGSASFAEIRAAAPGLSSAITGTVFGLTLLGFASKAGAARCILCRAPTRRLPATCRR